MAQLATVWVGSEAGGAIGDYFRLELDEQGRGVLTVHWLPGESAQAYEVRAYSLKKYDIELSLEPADPDAEGIYLRGTAVPYRLQLEVGGKGLNWKRRIALDRGSELLEQLKITKDRADRYWNELKSGARRPTTGCS